MKYGRLGFTESTLLFCYYLRNELKITNNEIITHEVSFLNWLFNTSGFYDASFNYNYNYVYSENYKKLMVEFYQMSKQSKYSRFLIHNNSLSIYLPDFYKNFDIVNYSFKEQFNVIKSFVNCTNETPKVLIINPISKLMKHQYDSGNIFNLGVKELYMDDFPKIEIQCYVNEYTFFNKKYNNQNSFDYVDSIMPEINSMDFDCVIISCGAISSLIANRLKKDYLIIGSDLLSFFGIKHDRIKGRYEYNEHWIDVPDECKPVEYKMVENGCYW